MAEGYRSRVAGNVVARQQRDPRAFSSPVGEGISALAEVGARAQSQSAQQVEREREVQHRIEMQALQRGRSRHIADRAAAFARTEATIASDLQSLRTKADPGAPEYEGEAAEAITRRWSEFADTLGDDPQIVDQFGPMIARASARAKLQEEGWALGQRVEKQGADLDIWASGASSSIVTDYSAANLQAKMDEAGGLVGMMDAPGNVREQKIYQLKSGFVKTAVASAIEGGQYQAARDILDSGAFDPFMSGDDKLALVRLTNNAQDTAERQAALEMKAVQDAVQDRIDTAMAAIDAGATEYPLSTLQALHDEASAAGLDGSRIFDIELAQLKSQTNSTFDTLPKVQSAVTALETKAAKGDLSVSEQIQLEHLTGRRKAMSAALGQGLKPEWAKGGESRVNVVAQLYAMPAEQRIEAARAIDNSGQLAAAVRLDNKLAARNAALGMEIRKANPRLVPGGKTEEAGRLDLFDEYVGGALDELSATRRKEVYDTAINIYAYVADQNGYDEFNEPIFRASINQALEGQRGMGGLVDYGGERVLAPRGVSEEGFASAIARHDFADAEENAATIKRKFVPYVAGGDGAPFVYEFRDKTGAVLFNKKTGRPYRLPLRAR